MHTCSVWRNSCHRRVIGRCSCWCRDTSRLISWRCNWSRSWRCRCCCRSCCCWSCSCSCSHRRSSCCQVNNNNNTMKLTLYDMHLSNPITLNVHHWNKLLEWQNVCSWWTRAGKSIQRCRKMNAEEDGDANQNWKAITSTRYSNSLSLYDYATRNPLIKLLQ